MESDAFFMRERERRREREREKRERERESIKHTPRKINFGMVFHPFKEDDDDEVVVGTHVRMLL